MALTAQEKTEVGKLIIHMGELGATYNQIGNGIRDFGSATARPKFFETLQCSVDALWEGHEGMRLLLNEPDRTAAVSQGINRVRACDASSLIYADKLDGLAAFVTAENSAAGTWASGMRNLASRIRNTNLDTFQALAFASPDPDSFPRVVGPHGDSLSAREHIDTMGAHFLRAVALGTALYGNVDVWPQDANLDFRELIRYATAPAQMVPRIWGMDVGIVVHPQDRIAISAAVIAGSGLRGEDFFRLLQEVSLFNGDPHQPPLHSGRLQAGGIVGNFAIGISEFPKALKKIHAVNTPEEIKTWWEGISNSLTATPPTLARVKVNFIPGFFIALARAWEAGDLITNSWIMFFHELPAPPPSG